MCQNKILVELCFRGLLNPVNRVYLSLVVWEQGHFMVRADVILKHQISGSQINGTLWLHVACRIKVILVFFFLYFCVFAHCHINLLSWKTVALTLQDWFKDSLSFGVHLCSIVLHATCADAWSCG